MSNKSKLDPKFERWLEQEVKKSKQQLHKKKVQQEADEVTSAHAKELAAHSENVASVSETLSHSLKEALPFLAHYLPMLQDVTASIPWLSTILMVFASLIKAATATAVDTDGKFRRGLKTFLAVSALALCIAALAVPAVSLPLLAASIGTDIIQRVWGVGAGIVSYFFGSWKKEREQVKQDQKQFDALLTDIHLKDALIRYRNGQLKREPTAQEAELFRLDKRLTESTNALRERRSELAENIHTAVLGAASLVGVALMFTPAAPVGLLLLGATAVYGVLTKFNLNPFQWLGKKLFGNFFCKQKHHADVELTETEKMQLQPAPVDEKRLAIRGSTEVIKDFIEENKPVTETSEAKKFADIPVMTDEEDQGSDTEAPLAAEEDMESEGEAGPALQAGVFAQEKPPLKPESDSDAEAPQADDDADSEGEAGPSFHGR